MAPVAHLSAGSAEPQCALLALFVQGGLWGWVGAGDWVKPIQFNRLASCCSCLDERCAPSDCIQQAGRVLPAFPSSCQLTVLQFSLDHASFTMVYHQLVVSLLQSSHKYPLLNQQLASLLQ